MKTTFFTGVGDSGISNTGKKQVPKDDPIFMLLGSLDECTSWLGFARVTADNEQSMGSISEWLLDLQQMLFIAQAEVAAIAFDYGGYSDKPRKFPSIKKIHLSKCEKVIKEIDTQLPQLKNFVLPGGSILSAQCDVARTIARKAERYAVISTQKVPLSKDLLAFLNRLSSVLFAIARFTNYTKGIAEQSPKY